MDEEQVKNKINESILIEDTTLENTLDKVANNWKNEDEKVEIIKPKLDCTIDCTLNVYTKIKRYCSDNQLFICEYLSLNDIYKLIESHIK